MSDHFTILRSKGLNLQTLIASYFPSVTLELVLLLDDSYNNNKLILGIKEKEKWVASANFTKSKKKHTFLQISQPRSLSKENRKNITFCVRFCQSSFLKILQHKEQKMKYYPFLKHSFICF